MAVQSMREIDSGYRGSVAGWIKFWEFLVGHSDVFIEGEDEQDAKMIRGFCESIAESLTSQKVMIEPALLEKFPKSYQDFVLSGGLGIMENALDYWNCSKGENTFFDVTRLVKISDPRIEQLIDLSMCFLLRDVHHHDNLDMWEGDDEEEDVSAYYFYGSGEDDTHWSFSKLKNWPEIIANAYLVAETRMINGEVAFMSPVQVSKDGEWESFTYTCDDHDVARYRSFAEMIVFDGFLSVLFHFESVKIGKNKTFDELASLLFDLDVLTLRYS